MEKRLFGVPPIMGQILAGYPATHIVAMALPCKLSTKREEGGRGKKRMAFAVRSATRSFRRPEVFACSEGEGGKGGEVE